MPKDVDVIWTDCHGNTELKSYHFENEEDKAGWYYFEDEPYLTKTALKKEFKLKDAELKEIIERKDIDTEEVTNEYRSFTVYCLSDVKELLKE